MKISELIESMEPFDWPYLKVILLSLSEDKDVLPSLLVNLDDKNKDK